MHYACLLIFSVFYRRTWNLAPWFIELHDPGKKIELKSWSPVRVQISIIFGLSIKENTFLIIQIREHDLKLLNVYFWQITYSTVQRQTEICNAVHRSFMTDCFLFICMAWFCIGLFFPPSKHTLLANTIPAAVLISHWVRVPVSHLWYANINLAVLLQRTSSGKKSCSFLLGYMIL